METPIGKPALSGDAELAELAALVDETDVMLAAAQAGEWETVAKMESARGARLEAYFNALEQHTRERYADQLRRAIEYILAMDKQILAMGETTKAEAVKSLRQSQSARQATATYQDNDAL